MDDLDCNVLSAAGITSKDSDSSSVPSTHMLGVHPVGDIIMIRFFHVIKLDDQSQMYAEPFSKCNTAAVLPNAHSLNNAGENGSTKQRR